MEFEIDLELGDTGRWEAELVDFPSYKASGDTREAALDNLLKILEVTDVIRAHVFVSTLPT